ncbi:Zn-dependent amino-or carboxypeptidase, M28 family [Tangfeifania diversioriginum]|uniref:Zn-dependent amino-or carboxypeptidase, M28 family n=1 Tax=Tangfeifania diversioriginum TaxID=1168035 RepID=A0A1M6ICR5_9BACT|nr:M28 family peptidase [Tangfeifania diversioriginum]SHJ32197.1 Zn-dependent amino-or carboxypeptidase, M28 family [Tangfeifania diversioriginum]
MKHKVGLLILIIIFSFFNSLAQDENAELLRGFHSISSHEILDFAKELSSEKYKGRLSGSPEYLQAAEWCVSKFEEWGVQPANNGSYFQYFPNEYSNVFSEGSVTYSPETGQEISLNFPEDYYPGSNSASGSVSGNLVYVGHGITAPELGYDDYKNVDVEGKIVLMESGIPYSKNDTTLSKWTPYAYHRYKFRNAVKHGAAGLLYIGKIANPNTVNLDGFVYAHISEEIADRIFADAGKDYKTVRKELSEQKIPSFEFTENQTATITAETLYFPNARSCNVVGLIEGSDPEFKNEVVIVGGHLDGQGYLGEIFPGALDNASGVSDILGAAKAFATSEIKPKRSILFILLGGEECGLYGSKFYTENPLFPTDKTVMMINLDMVGNGTGFFVSNGKSYPELFQHFESANNNYLHREMAASEQRKNYGRPRSDASLFENAGIPTFSLWTRNSVHPVYYHDPRDTPEVLTPEIMEDAAKLLYLGILGVANDEGLN